MAERQVAEGRRGLWRLGAGGERMVREEGRQGRSSQWDPPAWSAG